MVTDKDTESFGRDGVAFLPAAFEKKGLELLRQGIEENIFVRGSHLWLQRSGQANFGALTGDERVQVVSAVMTEFGLVPGDRPVIELYPQVWVRG